MLHSVPPEVSPARWSVSNGRGSPNDTSRPWGTNGPYTGGSGDTRRAHAAAYRGLRRVGPRRCPHADTALPIVARVSSLGAGEYAGNRTARTEKRRIFDEFVTISGFHRKHAIRVLKTAACMRPRATSSRSRLYDEAVREPIVVLWEASDRVCGKRLKPLLPILVPALERHGHLRLADDVRTRVLAASASTIDRVLAGPRGRARPSRREWGIGDDLPRRPTTRTCCARRPPPYVFDGLGRQRFFEERSAKRLPAINAEFH